MGILLWRSAEKGVPSLLPTVEGVLFLLLVYTGKSDNAQSGRNYHRIAGKKLKTLGNKGKDEKRIPKIHVVGALVI